MANDFSGDANCVAVWNLDNGALTADSKGGNTLANVGPVTNDVGDFKQGDASGRSDGANDYLRITDANLDAGFPLKSGDATKIISCAIWCKPDAGGPGLNQSDYLISKYNSTAGKRSWAIGMKNDGGTDKFFFIIGHTGGAGAEVIFFAGASPTLSRWFHIGFTFDDSDKSYRFRIWDDTAGALLGGAEQTGNSVNNISVNDSEFMLFRRQGNLYVWDGWIDEAVIFKDVLSSAEIDEIRQGIYGAPSGTEDAFFMGANV